MYNSTPMIHVYKFMYILFNGNHPVGINIHWTKFTFSIMESLPQCVPQDIYMKAYYLHIIFLTTAVQYIYISLNITFNYGILINRPHNFSQPWRPCMSQHMSTNPDKFSLEIQVHWNKNLKVKEVKYVATMPGKYNQIWQGFVDICSHSNQDKLTALSLDNLYIYIIKYYSTLFYMY